MWSVSVDLHGRMAWLSRALVLTALAVGLCFATARAANAETLNEALAAAYQYSPRLDAERARLRATDEDVARAMSGIAA